MIAHKKAKADNHIGGGQSSYRLFITSIKRLENL